LQPDKKGSCGQGEWKDKRLAMEVYRGKKSNNPSLRLCRPKALWFVILAS